MANSNPNSDPNPNPLKPKYTQPYRPHPPGYNSKAQIAARAKRAAARQARRDAALKAEEDARQAELRRQQLLDAEAQLEARYELLVGEMELERQARGLLHPRIRLEMALERFRRAKEHWRANPASRKFNPKLYSDSPEGIREMEYGRLAHARAKAIAFRPVSAAKVAVCRARKELAEFEAHQDQIRRDMRRQIEEGK